jgi:hypothetical protein
LLLSGHFGLWDLIQKNILRGITSILDNNTDLGSGGTVCDTVGTLLWSLLLDMGGQLLEMVDLLPC